MSSDESWVKNEFKSLSLGDKRLDDRMIDIATNMSQGPSLLLNQVSDDWFSVKASYRFFDNDQVTPEKIISPHIHSTAKRCLKYDYIIVIQDTTIIYFTRHQKTKGLGKIIVRSYFYGGS